MQRLDDKIFQNIKGKPVCIVGYQESYLEELCDDYDILQQIVAAVDNPGRRQGVHSFRGKEIEVVEYGKVFLLPEESVFIIANDFPRESMKYLEAAYRALDIIPPERVYFFVGKEIAHEMDIRRDYEAVSLKNIILFWSGPYEEIPIPDAEFGDNARALFEYMLSIGLNNEYELVWLVSQPERYANKYKDIKNVKFLPSHNILSYDNETQMAYYEALCLAKYIFTTDGYGFARNARPDQIRVQLWHGQGFKRRVNRTRCEHRYEYMTVSSEMYARLYADMFGLREDQMIISGYPREDCLFHPIDDWKTRLNIPRASKYIFWLPTFRSVGVGKLAYLSEKRETGDLPLIVSEKMLETLNRNLTEKDIVLIIKLHPLQRRDAVYEIEMSNIVLLENSDMKERDIDIYNILGHADALISDYSSVAVDFTVLNRPIAFTLDDYREYEEKRGLNWPNIHDWLPGKELFSFDDLMEFIEEIAKNEDTTKEKRMEIAKRFHDFFDDKCSARLLSYLGIINSPKKNPNDLL